MAGDERFDRAKVLLLAMGHMVTDSYANMIPPLLPSLRAAYGLSYAASGAVMSVFTLTSSIVQPVFGYYADRKGKRWLVALSLAWTAFFMSLIGIVGYFIPGSGAYVAILAIVALGGLGSASYHPQASTMVPRISGDHKGLGMSLFSAGGNLGYAVTPLLVVPIIALFGLPGTLLMIIPGCLMALLLIRYAPEAPSVSSRVYVSDILSDILKVGRQLVLITTIVCMRAWLFFGLITFLPLYLAASGESLESSSIYLFILLLFGAIGTLLGGQASDRFGKKPVIIISLLFTPILLSLAFFTRGYVSWAIMSLAGMALLASFSPADLIPQSLIPRNQGIASGIILGFAIGVGGLGVSLTGAISDSFGIGVGVMSLIALPFIAFVLSFFLPGRILPHSQARK